jgi:predicted RND superfamily exporter protein
MNEEGAVSKDGVNTDNVGDLRFLEKFFHNLYAPAIHKNRFYVLAGFFVFLALSIAYAAQLTGSDEPTKWLPDDDPVQKAFLVEGQDFSRSGVTLQVYFVHGLNTINRAGTNQFDSSDIGKVNFDDDFDPSSPNFQQTYLEFCDRMKTWEHVLNEEVFCPMYLFKEFVEDVLQESFPVPDDQFVAKMANYTAWYEEVNGPTPDFSIQNDPGERNTRRFSGASIYNLIRFEPSDPKKLRYMATVANMSLGILDPVGDIEPVYDDFQARMKEENSNSSMQAVTLGDGFQTAARWIDMELDKVLLRSALVGIGASLTIAFIIILASTTDLILTCLSMVSIGGTVASLIAMIVWIGWKMSIVESICLTILVGLSVDYTIHMANSWRHSTKSDDRKVRLQKTLTEIGISVLSASVTTFLSCLALFFTIVLFFVKFGIFIALTILFSTIYSFGMLTAMLALGTCR